MTKKIGGVKKVVLTLPLILATFLSSFMGFVDQGKISSVDAAGSDFFGAVGFVSSRPSSSDKNKAVSAIRNAGLGWDREEYTYSSSMDWTPYDAAYKKIRGKGIKILGLLTFPGHDVSHAAWKDYVKAVVTRYPKVSAWEIMNEPDNYLSASAYTTYLKEASTIIRSKTSAPIIMGGLTARKEVYPYWDGVKAAGGWDSFDAIGLHMFHNTTPYADSYENGTLTQEVQKVINTANRNGGKPIWITEIGYDSNKFGTANQAQWLAESMNIVRGFSEVKKAFVFRLYENNDGFGIMTKNFGAKPAYTAVKNAVKGTSYVASSGSSSATNTTVAMKKFVFVGKYKPSNIFADSATQEKVRKLYYDYAGQNNMTITTFRFTSNMVIIAFSAPKTTIKYSLKAALKTLPLQVLSTDAKVRKAKL